ncbi:MAG: hypothetical protein JWM59_1283 [Verrucomicrobiales bacterium]|nr:hypothetical protein [Verrucomicrobiales bacterium]
MELIEQELDFLTGLGAARQGEGAAVGGGEDHVQHPEGDHFFEDGAGGQAGGQSAQPRPQGGGQGEGQEADQDMSLNALFEFMVYGPDAEVPFKVAEGLLDLDELGDSAPISPRDRCR